MKRSQNDEFDDGDYGGFCWNDEIGSGEVRIMIVISWVNEIGDVDSGGWWWRWSISVGGGDL